MPPYAALPGTQPATAAQVPINPGADWYYNANPDAGWYKYLQNLGLAQGSRPVDKYSQGRQSSYYGNYQAAAASDPNMGWYDYLNKQTTARPDTEYQNQAPEQRGDFSSRTLGPRSRWIRPS